MSYIPTSDMIADLITKDMPVEKFVKYVGLMGLRNIFMKMEMDCILTNSGSEN